MASMYSLRVEAEERKAAMVDLASRAEFPELGAAKQLGPKPGQDTLDSISSDEDEPAAQLDLNVDWDAASVEFSAGNPRVEHITGIVHLFRDRPHTQQQLPAPGTAAPGSVATPSSKGSTSATLIPAHSQQLPADRRPVLCCLAIPADMSMADFCGWCGAYLSTMRSMRVLRREARQGVVCMVLMRFDDQQHADQFYEEFNLKPFSTLEPEIMCRLVYVREVQILNPQQQRVAGQAASSSHQQHTAQQPQASSQQGSQAASTAGTATTAITMVGAPGEASTSAGGGASGSVGGGSGGGGGPSLLEELSRSPRNPVLGALRSRSNRPSRCNTPRRLSASAGDGPDAWDQLAPTRLGTELPTCPVCLERLDEHISGVVITVCNHQFHSDCLRKWGDTSCPVCRYCTQATAHSSRCVTCNASNDLWICLICGHVGCGRYKAGHASEHWKATNHCYALELETQRVWDYAGDNYVHRLIQSKTDGKLVEVPTPGGPRRHGSRHGRHNSGGYHDGRGHVHGRRCAHGPGLSHDGDMASYDDYGDDISDWDEALPDDDIKEAMFASKLDHIADEYNHLLTSQLDSQRAYYEGLLAQQAATLTQRLSSVEAAASTHMAAAAAAEAEVKEAARKRQALERKLADMTAAHARAVEERGFLQSLNDTLIANQKELRQQVEAAKAVADERGRHITDLEEQVRDLMVYIEAGKVIQSSSELQDATVLPSPAGSNRGRGRGAARRR